MPTSISLTIPVWMPPAPGKRGLAAALADVAVPVLEGKDAPVVARSFHEVDRVVVPVDHRLHDGRLLIPAGRVHQRAPAGRARRIDRTVEDLEWVVGLMRRRRLPEGLSDERFVLADLHDAFQPERDRYQLHPIQGIRSLDEAPPRERGVLEEEIRGIEQHVVVIDGAIWRRSEGPFLLEGGSSALGPIMVHSEREIPRTARSMPLRFDGLRADEAERQIQDVYGGVRIEGIRPEALVPLPPNQRMDRVAIEFAVWHFLWMARWQGMQATRSVADAVVMARQAIDARWPEVEIDFFPKTVDAMARHVVRREMPPADDLLPVLGAIVSIGEGHFFDEDVRSWRLALLRAQELVRTDVLELEHLTV